MGCDIHFVVEQKTPNNGWVGVFDTEGSIGTPPWELRKYNSIWVLKERDYEFFARIASVRGSGERNPIGLPPDASALTKHYSEEDGDNGHSHSHMSLYDFVSAKLSSEHIATNAAILKLRGINVISSFLANWDGSHDISNFRVCFWFDN